MFSLFRGRTPTIRSASGRSISSLEAVRLGGVDQWVTIRGHNTANPILLFVHGGPGMSDMGAIRQFMPALEEYFTVVHWTQRGTGKSYSRAISDESMTIGQMLDDLESLARHVLQRLGQQKLFLVGQSWGTLLGMRLVQRAPELIHAYVGVNQIVDRAQEDLISYRAALALARKLGHRKAIAQLEAIGEPAGGVWPTIEGTLVHKGWVRTLKMITHDPKRMAEFGKAIAFNPEVTLSEIVRMFMRLRWNMERLWFEFCKANLFEEIPTVDVPVWFVAGKHDQVTNPELQARYLNQLQAPRTKYVLFEQSAHLACYEEPELFHKVMLNLLQELFPDQSLPRPAAAGR